MKYTAEFWKNSLHGAQHFFLDDDSVPELGDLRPDRLADVRPQERVQRRTVGPDRRRRSDTDARCSCDAGGTVGGSPHDA